MPLLEGVSGPELGVEAMRRSCRSTSQLKLRGSQLEFTPQKSSSLQGAPRAGLSSAHDTMVTMLRRSTNDTTPGMLVLGRKTYLAAAICGLVKKPAYDLFAVTPTADGSDKSVTLRARADESVADLKRQLAAKCGLAAVDLSLTWGSKPLWRDGYTLGEYGLRAGATLVATGRVRGGGGAAAPDGRRPLAAHALRPAAARGAPPVRPPRGGEGAAARAPRVSVLGYGS
jgi:hypothetical protein